MVISWRLKMIDPVERDLYRNLVNQEAAERETEIEENRRDERRKSFLSECVDFSNEKISYYIEDNHGITMFDFLNECLADDGVYEYFVFGNNSYYRNAINTLVDFIEKMDDENNV